MAGPVDVLEEWFGFRVEDHDLDPKSARELR
jgi:hypothetical protein